MDPSTADSDEPLDTLLRAAAPLAPRDFADGVERRIAADREQQARRRRLIMGVGTLLVAAAALVLWLMRPTLTPRLPPSGWTVVAQSGLTMTAPDGQPARDPDVGVRLTVAHGGSATLERPLARITLAEDSDTRVAEGGALKLSTGGARLEGPEARIDGDVATVAALGVSADIAVRLERRTNMNAATKTKTMLASLAAVMTVAAHDGGALVQAREHAPVLLAKNDHALLMTGLPPLVMRTPVLLAKNDPPAAKPTPSTGAKQTAAAVITPSKGLGKEVVQRVVRSAFPEAEKCYEAAREKQPKLEGTMRVHLTVVDRHDHSVVDQAEIVPTDDNDVIAPLFEQCVVGVLGKLQFPALEHGVTKLSFDYPIIFAAKEPSP